LGRSAMPLLKLFRFGEETVLSGVHAGCAVVVEHGPLGYTAIFIAQDFMIPVWSENSSGRQTFDIQELSS